MSNPAPSTRSQPTDRTRLLVWAAAAGRCTFCNRLVTEHEDLGEAVPIGELAHVVGWSEASPRGISPLDAEERRAASNLLLLCRNCHKPVDDGGVVGRYTVELLNRYKLKHEARVRFLTEIGAGRSAVIVRLVGEVRGVNPELTYDTVLEATTAAGYFPRRLPGNYHAEYDIDLRDRSYPGTAAYFTSCANEIDSLTARIHDGTRHNEISRLAVFAFARIPILVYLGARLDDKIQTLIFQRQRTDHSNAWCWPSQPGQPPDFAVTRMSAGSLSGRVALLVNLSGTVRLEDLPGGLAETHTLYSLSPKHPSMTGPSLIDSPAALSNFEQSARQFLAMIEADHGKIDQVDLFPAIPMSAAITLGRVLMPHVSPAWMVHDRDERNVFIKALQVRR